MIVLLAEEKAPNFLRFLPLLAMAGLILFRWLSEKIRNKEQEQQAEEDAGYRQESQEAMTRRAGTSQSASQPSQRTQPRPAAGQIHRYQPEIPAAPAPPDWRRPQPAESEQIVLAQDLTTAAALGRRQLSQEQRRQQMLIQAARRAKTLQAQRRQQAAELRARQDAAKAADQQRSRDLHDGQIVTAQLVSVPAGVLAPIQITVSRAQLRQAVVWAEILGPPRALRTYSFAY